MSTEIKQLTEAQKDSLNRPLPAEAVSPHPTKKFLSSIKSIYVTERLNEVFGVGKWITATEVVERSEKMVVVKLTLTIPEYGISYDCYGGNDNADLGDAYKGATTDALTKIASWMGIGADVFKGKQKGGNTTAPAAPAPPKKVITEVTLDNPDQLAKMLTLLSSEYQKDPNGFSIIDCLKKHGIEFQSKAVEERTKAIWMHERQNKDLL